MDESKKTNNEDNRSEEMDSLYIKKCELLYNYSKETINEEFNRVKRVEEKAIKFLTVSNILLIFLLFLFKEILEVDFKFECLYFIEIFILALIILLILLTILLIIITIDLKKFSSYSLDDTFTWFEKFDYDKILYNLALGFKKLYNKYMKNTDSMIIYLRNSIFLLKVSILLLIILLMLYFFNLQL